MSEKKPSEMTPAERQDWAMRNMPLSDDPAPTGPAVRTSASVTTQSRTHSAEKPESPVLFVLIGGAFLLLGGFLVGLAAAEGEPGFAWFGSLLTFPGAVMVLYGTIAAAVRLGMRHHRYEADRERSR